MIQVFYKLNNYTPYNRHFKKEKTEAKFKKKCVKIGKNLIKFIIKSVLYKKKCANREIEASLYSVYQIERF